MVEKMVKPELGIGQVKVIDLIINFLAFGTPLLSFRDTSSWANCNKQQKDTKRTVYAKIAQENTLKFFEV